MDTKKFKDVIRKAIKETCNGNIIGWRWDSIGVSKKNIRLKFQVEIEFANVVGAMDELKEEVALFEKLYPVFVVEVNESLYRESPQTTDTPMVAGIDQRKDREAGHVRDKFFGSS